MSEIGEPILDRRLRVAVLMGGTSSEREVSLVSGQMVAAALNPARYDVVALDTRDLLRLRTPPVSLPLPSARSSDPTPPTRERVPASPGTPQYCGVARPSLGKGGADGAFPSREGVGARSAAHLPADSLDRPDVVFIALHGKGGEDGTVQGLLEVMGIPYTGSGVLASALAMDKVMSKRVFKAAGIPVIEGIFVTRAAMERSTEAEFRARSLADVAAGLGFPVFVKPNAGGSTCGCALVQRPDDLYAAVREALRHDETALVERYVRGREITIGVLDFAGEPPMALPVIEIVPKGEYYDYESKYADGGSEHIIPARLPEALLARAQQIALDCHAALGCSGVSRTDIIAAGDDLYVLEVNTIPGMTPTSLLPQAAEHAGISFPELLDRLVRSAICNKQFTQAM